MKHENTKQFLGKRYIKNNRVGHVLQIGDECYVHPTRTSQMREKYIVRIIEKEINWTNRPEIEICTHKPGGHSAVLNMGLFERLELIV